MTEKKIKKTKSPEDIISKIATIVLLATLFFLPLVFVSTNIASFFGTKTIFLTIGVFLTLILMVVKKLKDNDFKIGLNILSLSIASIPLVYLIATIFSNNVQVSLVGKDFVYDNFLFMLILFILLFLTSVVFAKRQNTLYLYFTFALSTSVILIVYFFNLFLPGIFPDLNFFFTNISNTVGKLNDVSILAGIGLLFSIISLDIMSFPKKINGAFYALGVASLLAIVTINFSILWYVVGAFSLFILIFVLATEKAAEKTTEKTIPSTKKFPTASFVVLIVSLVIVISGGLINSLTKQVVTIDYTEARPSLQTTWDLTVQSVQTSPLLGNGPSRFDVFWDANKSEDLIATDYWDASFDFGFSFVSSLVITTGIIGIIPWIVFFMVYIYLGIKAMFNTKQDQLEKYISITSFSVSLYLWLMFIVYIPGTVVFALTMVYTGLFVASLYRQKIVQYTQIVISGNPRNGFVYIFVLIVLLILSIVGGYHYTKKFIADYYNQQAMISFQNNDMDNALNFSIAAYGFFNSDVYLQNISNIENARSTMVANREGLSDEDRAASIRNMLTNSINAAQTAIDYDVNNFRNYLQLASVYEYAMSYGFAESYENAKESYNKSFEFNSKNPGVYLSLARLEIGRENIAEARNIIREALEIKPNYVDAALLLSEIEVLEGNRDRAVSHINTALVLQPNSPILYFQLGALKYQDRDYSGAITALENAVILNQFYSNAKYLLGLSYDQVGRTEDALNQFADLSLLNPDNQEIQTILDALKRGENLSPTSTEIDIQDTDGEEDAQLNNSVEDGVEFDENETADGFVESNE